MSRLSDIGFQFGIIIYAAIWILSLIALTVIASSPLNILKIMATSILVLASLVSLSYYEITNQYLEIFEFEVLLNAQENLPDAIATFPSITFALFVALVGFAGFLIPGRQFIVTRNSFIYLPTLAVLILIAGILTNREGEGTQGLPSQLTPVTYGIVLAVEGLLNKQGESEVELSISPKYINDGDLIFIMDESIRGDYFDINSPQGVPTGIINYNPINFGIASSFANCSAPSNQSMRYGVSRATYLTDVNNKPSIWQYAKKAHYNTVYIDTQHKKGILGNHMSIKETKYIDDFIQILDENVILFNKDIEAAKLISSYLNNGTKDFIYVNKTGAHFPFEGKYPESEKHYKPTMPPSGFSRSFHEENEVEYPESFDKITRLKFKNSYKNNLHWNINTFFSELSINTISQPYTMLYTADHGQTFHDDGREGYGTHCSINITDPEEGRVPFIVFSNKGIVREKMTAAAKLNFNKISHFNIPSTTYQLMGYQQKDLDQYHQDIYSPLDEKDQKFLSKYYIRFGAQPIWNTIYNEPSEKSTTNIATSEVASQP